MTTETIQALIAKTWKNEDADLAPGKHFIDEEFTVRVRETGLQPVSLRNDVFWS